MSKIISNPIIVEFRFEHIGNNWDLKSYVEYGVETTEYPELGQKRKSHSLILTPAQETQIKQFAQTIIAPQLNTDIPNAYPIILGD